MSKIFYSIVPITLALSMQSMASTQTESSFEISCRAKAKEVAADTYRVCVTENRNAELDKVRKDYQERLRTLKEDYEKDLEKLGGKQKTGKKQDSAKIVASAKSLTKKQSLDEADPNIELRASKNASLPDESQMDIPEPIPVEKMGVEKN